jgi:uncharacterized membrane protein YfcA
MAHVIALIGLGLFAGLIASTLGLGGGFIYVPMLVVFFAFPQHTAQGTSLAVIVPTALVATYLHAQRGRVQWRVSALIGGGGVIGGFAGSLLALRLPADVLRRLFAVVLVVVAIRMFNR